MEDVGTDAWDGDLQWWRSEHEAAEPNPRMLADCFNLKANFNATLEVICYTKWKASDVKKSCSNICPFFLDQN